MVKMPWIPTSWSLWCRENKLEFSFLLSLTSLPSLTAAVHLVRKGSLVSFHNVMRLKKQREISRVKVGMSGKMYVTLHGLKDTVNDVLPEHCSTQKSQRLRVTWASAPLLSMELHGAWLQGKDPARSLAHYEMSLWSPSTPHNDSYQDISRALDSDSWRPSNLQPSHDGISSGLLWSHEAL